MIKRTDPETNRKGSGSRECRVEKITKETRHVVIEDTEKVIS